MKIQVIQGKIWTGPHEEGHTTLFVGYNSEPFSKRFDDMFARRKVNVKYWIDDRELTKEELKRETLKSVSGTIKAEYYHRYSDYTGYLWTEESAKVGGHDMLAELRFYVGKFLYMEIQSNE